MRIQKLFLGIALCAAATTASAANITAYDRATFQLALAGGTISGQNFDGIAVDTLLGTLGGVTYSASGGTPIVTNTYLTTTAPNGLGSTSVGYFQGTETATFVFGSAITAFGIDVNTYAPTAGDYTATLNIGDVIASKFDVFPGTATGQFIGFISDTAFTSVTITSLSDPTNGGRYTYTLDSLVYGDAAAVVGAGVPEPSTFGLLGISLAFLGYRVRGKRQK